FSRMITIGDACAALYPHSGTANDGKIVVASGQTVERFNPNGSLDTAFGDKKHGGGSVTVPWPIALEHGVVIHADGKIVVAGNDSSSTSFKLIRYADTGTVDTSFGSGGTATLVSARYSTFAEALQLQADGKLVLAGVSPNPNGGELARFNPNGTLDTTF